MNWRQVVIIRRHDILGVIFVYHSWFVDYFWDDVNPTMNLFLKRLKHTIISMMNLFEGWEVCQKLNVSYLRVARGT